MQYLNVWTKREFEQDGETKSRWYKVGYLKITDNDRQYLKLFHQPDTDFYIFDSEKKLPEIQA